MSYKPRLTAPDYNNKFYIQSPAGVPTNLISPGGDGRVLPNCFSGDTKFITDFGIKTMSKSVGHIYKVPTINNDWRWATVQYFGKQNLIEVAFTNGHKYKCTANHRWEVYTHNKKLHSTKLTIDLIPGMLIPIYNNGSSFSFTSVKSIRNLNVKEDVFCVVQKSTESFVLSGGEITRNCVGYAKGRVCELAGKNVTHIPGDAGKWWGNAPSVYKKSQKPKLGAIICWKKPGDYGHVAIVEKINKDGSILISESGYRPEEYNPNRTNILGKVTGSGRWHFSVRKGTPPNYCDWGGYQLQGFLIHDWCEEHDDARSEFITLAKNRMGDNIDWTKKQLGRNISSPWSASFISALAKNLDLIDVCFPNTDVCSDISRLGELRKFGTFYPKGTTTPQPGDIICINTSFDLTLSWYNDKYKCSDVGVVTKISNNEVGCVFGDRSGIVSGVTYKLSDNKIRGYYRPKWDNSTLELDSTHSVTFYGPLYETENTREDAIVREVSYMNSKLEPSMYSSDIKLSVINYTSILGSFFNVLGNNLGVSNVHSGNSSSVIVEGDLTSTEKQIIQHLMKNGLTCAGSVGVLANIYHESGCRTDVIEYGYSFSNGGVGLCQWTNYPRSAPTGRKTNMVKFVGNDWKTDLTGQLDFLLHELNTGYTGVLSTLKSASNNVQGARNAADIFVRKFEIPANVNSASVTRQSTAEKYWKKISVR